MTEAARRGRLDTRWLLLGDWHWLVRDPLDVLRVAFLAGTVLYAIQGRSTAVGLTAASILLLVARVVNLPRRFDLGVIVAMTFIAWGTALSLYGRYHFYDTIVHAVTPAFYAPVLYVVLVRLEVLVDPERTTGARQYAGVFVSTFAIGMAVGAGYEIFEWLSDTLFGTAYVENADDTGRDLLADALGSLAGATLVTVWAIRSWSTRRAPVATAPPSLLWARARQARALLRSSAVARRVAPLLRPHPGGDERPAVLALSGVVALLFGAGVLLSPRSTFRTVELLVAIALIAQGAIDLVGAIAGEERRRRLARAAGGAALVVVGGLLLSYPGASRELLVYAIGVLAVVLGFVETARLSGRGPTTRERWLGAVVALTAFAFGVVILALPDGSVRAIRLAVGLYVASFGALRLAQAWESRTRVLR